MDYETGINHSVRGVAGCRQGGDCRLTAPDLTFTATSCSKGVLADKVIHGHLGPGLVDHQLTVYQGPLRFTYTDPVCCPHPPAMGQWCL